MIDININKAREIYKNIIRESRKSALETLDVEYIRAQEQGLDTSGIVAKKQQLRDMTNHPKLLNAKNITELKSFWPSVLGDKPDSLK